MADKNPFAGMDAEQARRAAQQMAEKVERYGVIATDYHQRLEKEAAKATPDPQRLKDLKLQMERAAQHADAAHRQQIHAEKWAEHMRGREPLSRSNSHERGRDRDD